MARKFHEWVWRTETSFWDGIYGIQTLGRGTNVVPEGSTFADAHAFCSKNFFHIKIILRRVPMTENDVFYDIGCGSGRFVCCAALRKIKKCIGVELSKELCALARRNAANLRFRKANIEICNADASELDYSDGTIFALFNPFGAKTLAVVLERIQLSVVRFPRKVRFIYLVPDERIVFDHQTWLKQTAVFRPPGSTANVIYYENDFPVGDKLAGKGIEMKKTL
jgi:SAM-dependent methyltransferase